MDDERRKKLQRFLVRAVPIALVVAILGFWPLPYYVIGPWAAEDLNHVVHVSGASPPPGGSLFDTTIIPLPGRPATLLAAKLLPGVEIVPRTEMAPPNMSDFDVIRASYASQEEGKHSAEVVAARAAGLPVEFKRIISISGLYRKRKAPQCFALRDELVNVDGAPIDSVRTLAQAAESKPVGSAFAVRVQRGAAAKTLRCTTEPIGGKPRFGVTLSQFDKIGNVPIVVTYSLPWYQSGGSSGLMFALQIYRTLTHADLTHGENVAGTGVIDDEGNVGPIVGARQKIIAAKRQGATIFLVPWQNYDEVRGTFGMHVIPVGNFNEAVNWLSWRLRSCANAAADIGGLDGHPILGSADRRRRAQRHAPRPGDSSSGLRPRGVQSHPLLVLLERSEVSAARPVQEQLHAPSHIADGRPETGDRDRRRSRKALHENARAHARRARRLFHQQPARHRALDVAADV